MSFKRACLSAGMLGGDLRVREGCVSGSWVNLSEGVGVTAYSTSVGMGYARVVCQGVGAVHGGGAGRLGGVLCTEGQGYGCEWQS